MRFTRDKQEKKATTTKLKSGKKTTAKQRGENKTPFKDRPENQKKEFDRLLAKNKAEFAQKKAEDKAELNVGLEPSNQKKAEDKADLNVGVANRTTKDFIDDLKDAYKAGLFTGGTKTKAFMAKYGLSDTDIAKLRTGIDQGLGTRIGGKGGNILTDYAGLDGILRDRGTIKDFYESPDFLQQRSSEIFEPGMTKYDRDPITGLMALSPVANIGLRGLDAIAGGSPRGLRGLVYARDVLGLTGEDLDNFAATVANDRNLYNQIMSTPEMQKYQLDEFRAETVKQARANRDGRGDPNPISGTQPGEDDDDDTTDPGTDPDYTPPPQNFYTFFDPNLGRYRSGTYDEYLQYVTAKDGGIIQLQQGGALPNAPGGVASQEVKKELDELFADRKEIQDLVTPTKSEQEGSRMIMSEIDDRAKAMADMEKEGIMSRLRDQSRSEIFRANNPDIGPALREDLGFFGRLGDSGLSLLMEALRKSDITTGSANQFIEEALNNFVAAGIIPPNTSYDQLTDPFKDLITREAAMIANSMAKPIDYLEGRDMESMQLPNMSFDTPDRGRVELPMTILKGKEGDENMIRRSTSTQDPTMYNVADGGIIGLKQGGMNDMMQANELMFKDPSDKEEWEYNV
jgi:hypothetical protein